MLTPDVPYGKETGYLICNKCQMEFLESSKKNCFNETCWRCKARLLANEDINPN